MKKLLKLLCLVTLMIFVCIGCNKKEEVEITTQQSGNTDSTSTDTPEQKDVTITLLHHYSEESARGWLDVVAKGYTEKTGIKVDIQATGADNYDTLLKTKISGGDAPDIFILGTESFETFTKNQYLADLSNATFWDNIVDGVKEGTTYKGSNYYVPLEPTAMGAIYNRDVFNKLGISEIPETYSEYIEMLDTIKAAGIIPVAVASKEWWTIVNDYRTDQLSHLLKADPKWMTKKETRETKFIDDEAFIKSLEVFKDRYAYSVDDPFGTDWGKATTMVGNGEAAMLMMGNFGVGAIKEKVPDADLGMFAIPVNENPEDTFMPTSTTAGYVVFGDTPRMEEAKGFLDYMVSPKNGNLWIKKTNRMINFKGTAIPSEPTIADVLKYQEEGKTFDISAMQIDFTQEFTTAQVDVFTQYLLGKIKTAKEAAEELDVKFDEIAAKRG